MFFTLFLLVFGASIVLNLALLPLVGGLVPGVREKYVSHNEYGKDKVVILPIEGVIWEADDSFVKRAIDAALKDEHVKAMVLRVESPGGSVSASDYLYHHLCALAKAKEKKAKFPIVVSMGSVAASGGYYVSMAVGHEPDTIFAEPTCFTGSIGVIIPHYNVSAFMQEHGLADDSIASNPLKQMGSMTKSMTPAERKLFQALVDESFEQFKKIVRSGRDQFEKDPKKLDALATGQIYTADKAVMNGLIDKIGFLEAAVARAIELAGLDVDKVKVVRYKPEPTGLRSLLMGGESRAPQPLDLKALLDMTTPKAYYLVSWLPGLAGGAK